MDIKTDPDCGWTWTQTWSLSASWAMISMGPVDKLGWAQWLHGLGTPIRRQVAVQILGIYLALIGKRWPRREHSPRLWLDHGIRHGPSHIWIHMTSWPSLAIYDTQVCMVPGSSLGLDVIMTLTGFAVYPVWHGLRDSLAKCQCVPGGSPAPGGIHLAFNGKNSPRTPTQTL